jgi:hypothetical protein
MVMTERQAEYNLEWAHQQLLDHREALELERERFEDEIMMEEETFTRWAKRYIAKDNGIQPFLDWCWERHARTLRYGWSEDWEDKYDDSKIR